MPAVSAPIRLTILGQPCSKANSRRLFATGDRKGPVRSVKSQDAIEYERSALRQIPPKARLRLEGPVRVTVRMFYASERPDLDESIVLDVLQDRWSKKRDAQGNRVLVQAGVYRNDRQVREKHVFHGVDARDPRAEVVVEAMQPQQAALALPAVALAEAF